MYTGFWWGKPEGKRPLGRPRCRWEDNIKMYFQEVGLRVDYIDVARYMERWRSVVNAVVNIRFPCKEMHLATR